MPSSVSVKRRARGASTVPQYEPVRITSQRLNDSPRSPLSPLFESPGTRPPAPRRHQPGQFPIGSNDSGKGCPPARPRNSRAASGFRRRPSPAPPQRLRRPSHDPPFPGRRSTTRIRPHVCLPHPPAKARLRTARPGPSTNAFSASPPRRTKWTFNPHRLVERQAPAAFRAPAKLQTGLTECVQSCNRHLPSVASPCL